MCLRSSHDLKVLTFQHLNILILTSYLISFSLSLSLSLSLYLYLRVIKGYWWSPDSKSILYQITDTKDMEKMHISDPTRPNLPPNVNPYPRPGEVNAKVRLEIKAIENTTPAIPVIW